MCAVCLIVQHCKEKSAHSGVILCSMCGRDKESLGRSRCWKRAAHLFLSSAALSFFISKETDWSSLPMHQRPRNPLHWNHESELLDTTWAVKEPGINTLCWGKGTKRTSHCCNRTTTFLQVLQVLYLRSCDCLECQISPFRIFLACILYVFDCKRTV